MVDRAESADGPGGGSAGGSDVDLPPAPPVLPDAAAAASRGRRPVRARPARSSLLIGAGWAFALIGVAVAAANWSVRAHRREPKLQALLDGELAFAGEVMLMVVFWNFMALLAIVCAALAHRRTGRPAALVLLGVATCAVLGNTAAKVRSDRVRISDAPLASTTPEQERRAAQDMAAIVAAADDGTAAVRPSIEAHGELALVMEVMAEHIAAMRGKQAEYVAAVDALGVLSIFEAEALDSEAELRESLRRLSEVRKVHAAMLVGAAAVPDQTRAALAALPFSARAKEQLLRDFETGLARGDPLRELIAEYEVAMFDEMAARLEILLAALGRYRIEGSEIHFDDDADRAAFHACELRHNALAERQEAVAEILTTFANTTTAAPEAKQEAQRGLESLLRKTRGGRELAMTREGITLGGERITMPWSLDEATRVLGDAYETQAYDDFTMTFWSSHGIAAFCGEGADAADLVMFVTDSTDPEEPVFTGRVTLMGQEVRPHDTPWSLNRRLTGQLFECVDDAWEEWWYLTETYAVTMTMREDGLAGDVTLRSTAVVEAPEAAEPAAGGAGGAGDAAGGG